MKGLILSGGKGTRLRPLTHTQAKQLVPVANKPILFYGIEALVESGIKDIGIVVGETKAEIKEAVGNGSRWGARIAYIEQSAPLGLAHAVKISEGYLKKDPFVMYLGDNIITGGVLPFVERFVKERPNSQILLAHVPNPSEFGVAELSKGRVVRLEEKPKKPKSDLALVGVYLFDSTIFEAVNAIKPSKRNELEITDAIQYLIRKKFNVQSHIIDGWWKDTGKLEDILEANRLVLDSKQLCIEGSVDKNSRVEFKVVVSKGASIVNSSIRGPAVIGENVRIVNSYIGPFTSIDRDVYLENVELEHSIVLQHSKIKNIRKRISDSLIGKNVVIEPSNGRPESYQFMVGDNSSFKIH
ncbi:MAG: glucose-1-phosphate thymidylyltransferase [Nitrospinae bacterium]|nr:glucose-1-phosphate thymidylyltransferase [Nitrospinota bacterium]